MFSAQGRVEEARGDKDIATLLEFLKSDESELRWRAANALSDLRAVSAVPGLTETLEDQDDFVRVQAAIALWVIAGEKEVVVPLLVKTLRQGTYGARRDAAYGLGEIGEDTKEFGSVAALLGGLSDKEATVRAWSASALVEVKADPKVVVPVLIRSSRIYRRWVAKCGNAGFSSWKFGEVGIGERKGHPVNNGSSRIYERARNQLQFNDFRQSGHEPRSLSWS